jgi:membrane-associated protease RseP (regulator of RpoE activity)
MKGCARNCSSNFVATISSMDKEQKRILLQIVLFLVTLVTATLAGAEWNYSKSSYAVDENQDMIFNASYSWADFMSGLPFSLSLLLILSVHEFGHYFTARYHKIKTSLPYYIPLPPIPMLLGTMGAIIRIRERIPTTTKNFDIGIAGPLAGFVAAVLVLAYGFMTLPPPEYIFDVHPEYKQFGLDYAQYVYNAEFLKNGADILLGKNLLFHWLGSLFAAPARMPNDHEIMHFPLLFAGYISLVFTALNLVPVGQLDGGHVVYGLFGAKGHQWIARSVFLVLIFFAGIGIIRPGAGGENILWSLPLYVGFLYFTCTGLGFEWKTTLIISLVVFLAQYLVIVVMPTANGFQGWLLFAFLLGRFIGVNHPGAQIEEPLTDGRKILGWIALAILVLCFTPAPIEIITYPPAPGAFQIVAGQNL